MEMVSNVQVFSGNFFGDDGSKGSVVEEYSARVIDKSNVDAVTSESRD